MKERLSRLRAYLTPVRLVELLAIFSVIAVTIDQLHPALLLSSTTITGGDTGSHVALSYYLRTTGNPLNLLPWYPGWFAGMPSYAYYFALPDALAAWAGYVINFTVAFKLVTILGSILMPITAYVMARLFKAPRPIPAALAMFTLPFLFDASFTIDGGNLFSTMAGEYAFSLSLALALLTIGLFARGIRSGKGYWLCAIALSLTLASHVLPWFYALLAIAVLVAYELLSYRARDHDTPLPARRRLRPLSFPLVAGVISFGLSAWWLLNFATTQALTNSMGYQNDPTGSLHAIFSHLGWYNSSGGAGGDRWVILLAFVAAVVALWVKERLGLVLASLSVLSLLAFVADPQSIIWNERLVPFWYISVYLLAGWLVGYTAHRLATHQPSPKNAPPKPQGRISRIFLKPVDPSSLPTGPAIVAPPLAPAKVASRQVLAPIAVMLIGLLTVVPGLIPSVAADLKINTTGNQVTSWAAWNYSGYQKMLAWPEFHNIITTMDSITQRYGCGRTMWEYNANENRFGTPMAFMTLPYWTNNCVDSMEGLFFESSPTTPYHFLNQAELSASPSDPQLGLDYGSVNVALGVQHLQMLGVRYFFAYSPSVIQQANADPNLTYIASSKAWPSPGTTWRFYLVHDSAYVTPLKDLPNVVANISSRPSWLAANEAWYLNQSAWTVPLAASGPSSWPRTNSPTKVTTVPIKATTSVTKINMGLQSLSFHVSTLNVPVVVKISYYPRWHAIGATGPYRISPNLMVVIPTSHDVSLVYANSPVITAGDDITLLTVLTGLGLGCVTLRRHRRDRAR